MKFNSIEEIKDHFEIDVDDSEELKNCLLEIIKKIHPDKNGGEFRTKADEKYYHEIQDAIEYLDNINNLLVTKEELSSITQILKDIIPIHQNRISENYLVLENKIQSSIKFYKSKHLFPKITTSAIALILTSIWLFPESVSKHPVLKNYLNTSDTSFGLIWFLSLLLCAITWVLLKMVETRNNDLKKGLSLETNMNKIFTRFVDYSYHGKIADGYFYFTKDELIEFIISYDFKKDSLIIKRRTKNFLNLYKEFFEKFLLLNHDVDLDLVQSVSEVIIEKGLQKKVIKKVDSYSINDTFKTKKEEPNYSRIMRNRQESI